MKIREECMVAMEYVLTLEDGKEVDRNPAGEPIEVIIGAQQIVPGLEQALLGKEVGEKFQITLKPDEAYGQREDSLIKALPKEDFSDIENLQPGMVLTAETEDEYLEFEIVEIKDNEIVVDFNHPLAGIPLTFDITVASVRQATAEELDALDHHHHHECTNCGCH